MLDKISYLFNNSQRLTNRSNLDKFLRSGILGFFNVHATRKTGFSELQLMLDNLQPQATQKPLIRLGPKGDGGYLVPDDLDDINACFSPGVSDISGFEKDCADRGMKVFLADQSVDQPAETHELFKFTKKYIGLINNDDFMTMDDWVANSSIDPEKDLLLQMDIEGFEYEVLLGMSNQLMNRFRIMVIEFHGLDELWNKPFFGIVSRVFDKITKTHTCVHNHPNNCCGSLRLGNIEIPTVTEITFMRNDRIEYSSSTYQFPHLLDCDSTSKPPLPLPSCWHRKIGS